MENPEHAAQMLAHPRRAGLASTTSAPVILIAYLPRFPFDTIKIDQSFVRASNRARPVILRSIIALAHDLSMEVVAEGGNRSDAVELYGSCEYAQGYAFGEPMSADAARKLLTAEALELAR